MKKINLEKRYESKAYEKFLNLACAGSISCGLAGIGIAGKSIIEKLSGLGLLGLIFECEQECESEILSGISEFIESGDFETIINPLIRTFKHGETYENKNGQILFNMFKKYFT